MRLDLYAQDNRIVDSEFAELGDVGILLAGDRDDLFASAVTIAMFRAFNVTDRVVHFDYNSILGEDDPEYLKIHEESVRGAAQRFGLPEAVIFNDSTQLAAAVDSVRDAVNASSATKPLYFIVAGPMEVPWRGIHAADPDKRQYVYCISHTVWNDLFFWDTSNPEITHNKRDLVELGVNWIQIAVSGSIHAMFSTLVSESLQNCASDLVGRLLLPLVALGKLQVCLHGRCEEALPRIEVDKIVIGFGKRDVRKTGVLFDAAAEPFQ